MNIILLSGGSGKRLWPISNESRSKQFIPLLQGDDGEPETMVERTYRKIGEYLPGAPVLIATSKEQEGIIKKLLGDRVEISLEPSRRDTFPAISLAAAYLKYVKGKGDDEKVIILPIDTYAEDSFYEQLPRMAEILSIDAYQVILMGTEAKYPSTEYGYIGVGDGSDEFGSEGVPMASFYEKPDSRTAESMVEKGFLWNMGVVCGTIGYFLEKAAEAVEFTDYDDLYSKFHDMEQISFDYAVLTKEKRIGVIQYVGEWKDIGTWQTLSGALEKNIIGRGVLSDGCNGTHIINQLNIPIVAADAENLIISASPQGVLVAEKNAADRIKPLVMSLEDDDRFGDCSWGSYSIVDMDENSLVIRVTLYPGHAMHYHNHLRRDEVWVVTSGEGITLIDGMEQEVKTGDVITMSAGCKHKVTAKTTLKMVEVQLGKEISALDKEVLDDE